MTRTIHAQNTWFKADFPGQLVRRTKPQEIDGLRVETHIFESDFEGIQYVVRVHVVFPFGVPSVSDADGLHQALVGRFSHRLLESLKDEHVEVSKDESRAFRNQAERRFHAAFEDGMSLVAHIEARNGRVIERYAITPTCPLGLARAEDFVFVDDTAPAPIARRRTARLTPI